MPNDIATRTALQPEVLPAYSFEDMQRMSQVAIASGLYKFTLPQAQTLMMLCQSEGIHPIKALSMYWVIDGRPALQSVYMLAKHMASGGKVEWFETSSTAAECRFSHPTFCPDGVRVRYTIEDAKVACLAHKDNWKNNPGDMLVWRVVSRGVKRANPACLFGLDVPEPEEQLEAIESPARKALIDHMAGRRESPKESHPPVADTTAALKQHEAAVAVATTPVSPPVSPPAQTEPATEWGKKIAEATLGFNQALAGLADQNPTNLKLRQALRAQQVVNAVLNDFIERDVIEEDSLKNDKGKRDPKKAADAMSLLWSDDSDDVEAAIGRYLGSKMTDLMKTTEPAEAPIQGELLPA